jgi:hypothetical protein
MMLNAPLVEQLITKMGLKKKWVISQMGLKSTTGKLMLNDGLLPKDEQVQKNALKQLATILGVEVRQILLRLPAKMAS